MSHALRPALASLAGMTLAAYAGLQVLGRVAGTTSAERRQGLPGDELVDSATLVTEHAIDIAGEPQDVWPWLTQLGWHLGGYYTPQWVDRLLFPGNWPSLDRLDPALVRDLRVGDLIPDGPPGTAFFRVATVAAPHLLVLHSTTHVPQGWKRHSAAIDWTWCFALSQPAPQRTRVRLRVRGKTAPWWLTTLYQVAIVPADYVMATGMLRGLKRRVEARSLPAASGRQPLDQATYEISAASRSAGRSGTPLWGLRRQPGRLALAVFRLPLRLYRRTGRWLLGDTFLLLVHAGRKTGQPYSTVAMVLRHDPHSGEAVICSAWGKDADWVRNIQAHPALKVQIGRESFTPDQHFLSPAESVAVLAGFQRQHPHRARLLASVLGWGDLRSEAAAREFVSTRPFVSFRPFSPGREPSEGDGHD